jgi:hypothetical protein
MAVAAIAGVTALLARVPHRLVAWLPSIGFLVFVVATAGYMPNYFLSPLNITLALPVALALAHAQRSWIETSGRAARVAVAVPIAALCFLNLWQLNLVWTRAYASVVRVEEEYCQRKVGRTELINTASLGVHQSGSHRLSYLGFNVDDRALGAIMARPEVMPDVILMSEEHLSWLNDFKNRPARNELIKASGYSYNRFEGLEPLGYRLVETVQRPSNWCTMPPWIAETPMLEPRVRVYRRDSRPSS